MISSGLPAAIRSSTLPVRTAKVQRTLDLQITRGCIRVSRLHTSRCRLRNKWPFFRSENEPVSILSSRFVASKVATNRDACGDNECFRRLLPAIFLSRNSNIVFCCNRRLAGHPPDFIFNRK